MKISNAKLILIAIILVIVMVLIYWKFDKHSANENKSPSSTYEDLYQRSNGDFDNNAAVALNAIEHMENPTAEDDFRAGNILELNVLQGGAQLDPVVTHNIVNHYQNTINRAITNTRRTENPINLTFMLDHILNFGETNLGELQNGVRMTAIFGGNDAVGDLGGIANGITGVTNDMVMENIIAEIIHMTNDADVVRTNVTEANATKAAETAKNKREFAYKFSKMAKTHTSDPQNVHDSSVRADNKHSLAVLRSTASQKSPDDIIKEVREYILSSGSRFDGVKIAQANKVLNEIAKGGRIVAYDETENMILKYVWDRTNIPEHSAKSTDMKDAVVVSLYQSIDSKTGNPVCINGRASNIIGSLVILDNNPTVGAALTEEQYKNEIINASVKILDEEIEKALNSGSEDMKKVGQSYIDSSVECKEEFEEEFLKEVKSQIDEMINTYSDKMSKNKLNKVREDCYVSAGIV